MYFWTNRDAYTFSLNRVYQAAGITKQGFAKQRCVRKQYKEEEQYIIQIVQAVRQDHPVMGCRTIYFKMNPVFIGRDKFEQICRDLGFMIERRKSYKVTTDSSGVIRFVNLIAGLELTQMDQVWSSDITYFEVDNVFYYITFIIDNYTRRIVGHQVSSRLLCAQTTLPALSRAIRLRGEYLREGIIFHSDGGGQYYADIFLSLTKKYGFKNSMCEYAWENPKAERINGTIKNDYLKYWDIQSLQDLTKGVDRAVKLYNEDKPHSSLGRLTPVAFENKLLTLVQQNKKEDE